MAQNSDFGSLNIFPAVRGGSGGLGNLQSITGQVGGPVFPDGTGTIFINTNSNSVLVAGNTAPNTLTFDLSLISGLGILASTGLPGSTVISNTGLVFAEGDSGNRVNADTQGVIFFRGVTGGNIFTIGNDSVNTIFIGLTGAIPVTGGGTGSTTFISNTIVIFNGTSLTSLAPCSATGQVLVCEGPGNPPSFVTITGINNISVTSNGGTITISLTGVIPVTGGGTGSNTFISNTIVIFNGTSLTSLPPCAATGQVLVCEGPGNPPSFVSITGINNITVISNGGTITIGLTGVIPVTGGGTGSNTFISNTIVIFNGTSLTSLPPCAATGQVLVCEGPGNPPSFVTITGGDGITVISNGSTITVTGSGLAGDFHTESGDAFPVGGIINILGATNGNIFTSAVPNGGSNVFIQLTGVIPVTGGGTGGNTFISNSLITFNGTSLTSIGSCSTPGLVLVCEGPGNPPSFVPVTGSGAVTVTASGSGISIFAPGGQSVVGAQMFFTNCGTDAIPALTTGLINIFGATGGNIWTCAIPEDGDTIFIQLTGVIPVTGGGTGSNTFISNTIVIFNGTSLTSLPPCSSTGQILVCEGPGNPPSFVSITGVGGITVISTGTTITVGPNPGAFVSSLAPDDGFDVTADPATGEITVTGDSSAIKTFGTSPGSHTLTLTVTGGGIFWNDITGAGPVSMLSNNGYVNDHPLATVAYNLPGSPNFGDVIKIAGGTTGTAATPFTVTATGGKQIIMGNSAPGTVLTPTPSSDCQFNYAELLYIGSGSGAGTPSWTVLSMHGNFQVT